MNGSSAFSIRLINSAGTARGQIPATLGISEEPTMTLGMDPAMGRIPIRVRGRSRPQAFGA